MDILINICGALAILFVIWWFWVYREAAQAGVDSNSGPVDIIVDSGVYQPAQIRAEAGKEITLRFLRKDKSPCAEKVIFSDLDISADLPVGKPHEITITPKEKGTYEFTCQMAMYRGALIVE